MKPYLDLLRHVREHGVRKPTRCVLRSTGGHVDALSVFAPPPFRWDLRDGFPLVTTKRVDFNAVAHELLWFLSGSTNVRDLERHGVNIWSEWADPETGELGPIYGRQWRGWGRSGSDAGYDQVSQLDCCIGIAAENPSAACARRLILSAWNVADIDDMALPPCHVLAQFDVTDIHLSCHLYQRSADCFLGVPYNIASYALLTHMLAHVTGLGVGTLTISFGDAHIYLNHLEQVDEQLTRGPVSSPVLKLAEHVRDIDDFTIDHVELYGYAPRPALRGEVAV